MNLAQQKLHHEKRLEVLLRLDFPDIWRHEMPEFAMRSRALIYCDVNKLAPAVEEHLQACVSDWAIDWLTTED